MILSNFIQPVRIKAIVVHLFGALGLFGVLLLPPFAVTLVFGAYSYSVIFGLLAAGCGTVGFGIWYNTESVPSLKLLDAIVITSLVYLLFSMLGALPFLPLLNYLNGLFEAMSGFTTTGLSMLNEAAIPLSIHFYRAYLQWVGGMGIIVLSLAILIRPGKAAFKLYRAEYGEQNIMGSVETTAKTVIKIYLILTVVGYIAFLVAGMGAYDGLIHILTTIPTGGFARFPGSIGYYHSPAISATVTLFMILGAVSFPLYYYSFRKNSILNSLKHFFLDDQVRGMMIILGLATVSFLGSFGFNFSNIVPSFFQAVTALTTTGFNTVEVAGLSDVDKFVTTVLMIIGGSSGSTAGGIKVVRLLILLGLVRAVFFRTILPSEAKIPVKFGSLEVKRKQVEGIAAFTCIYLIMLFFSTFGIMRLEGAGLVNALFEVASAEGTVGLSVGLTSTSLNPLSKIILIINMWLGRVEILPVLVLFVPPVWHQFNGR